ncbi:CoA transferase [Mycobacterium sp. MYCO198283]|uniref:CaiB/BaiF CoA-transferase family protein n=1 Tax=Mycobacterium sp. MYCO198283 TaxID=2883505 RepID=UPI001E33B9C7|nr:CoA transferase [Mycobacterium sp. MYCO198283]MCG5433216.1 CoA transferase [Mycobacterium sp. MYCO198283]
MTAPLPLAGVRVLDLADATADAVGRQLADLGADVVKVEPPGGLPDRRAAPAVGAAAIAFALHNANKRAVILDERDGADRDRFFAWAAAADILVDSGLPGQAARFGTTAAELATRHPRLVALHVTDFGTAGPRAGWRATEPVLYAMSTALSRSGPTAGTPVLPPAGIASATAGVQATWAVLAAYHHRLTTGTGDFVDFSRYEGVLLGLDPPYGTMGQAAQAQRRKPLWRGRPRNQDVYPIFRSRDGFVRVCVMSARQWRSMWTWLGEPEEFSDPAFEQLGARIAATEALNARIAGHVAEQRTDDLVAAGQERGIPIAAVLPPAEVLRSDHFRKTGALTATALGGEHDVSVPVGPYVVDGHRAGWRGPVAAAAAGDVCWSPPSAAAPSNAAAVRPFDGLRILDLGIIVAGGELGRLFADLGAEVIKIESAGYPDGLRQTRPGQPMSETFALAHRNEFGLGLDLRSSAGADLFRRLVAESDAVFANFKPGTLAALGFSYDELRAINPAIVLAESSAYGDTGPWSRRLGYGPLVRASAGVTALWSGDAVDGDRPGYWDATTVFPDHISARVTAIAALAALIRRRATGVGGRVHVSQAEVAVDHLATHYVAEAARAVGLPVTDDPASHEVFPCAGDDEWCVISVRDAADRERLAAEIGGGPLPADPNGFYLDVAAWTTGLDKFDVADRLQRADVPAGPMYRPADVLADPQVRARELYAPMHHPLFDEPMPSETGPAAFRRIPAAELRPAPMPGEHTREICQKLLGLTAEDIERLYVDGVLFEAPATQS